MGATFEHAVEIEGLGKAYRVYPSPLRRLLEGLTLGSYRAHQEVWALRGVDLRLRPGGALGICGANGAGKSTLLRILAGTTVHTEGRYRIRGNVASILELGQGFHYAFSGRDNVRMSCALMGLGGRYRERKIDEIIEFAELGDAIDDPVRTYSSGMGMRLGFSVAVAADPDVLLIDEVFAVGDMYFQKKCIDKIFDFGRRNKTVLLCTHSLYDLRQICDEAVWVRDGRIASHGDSIQVTNDYATFQKEHMEAADPLPDFAVAKAVGREDVPKIRLARIHRMGSDAEATEVESGDSLEVRIWWENPDPERYPIHLLVGFVRQDRVICTATATHMDGVELSGAAGCTVLQLPSLQLLPGTYLVPVWLLDEQGVHRYQEYSLESRLVVRSDKPQMGVFLPEHEWVQEQADSAPFDAPCEEEAALPS